MMAENDATGAAPAQVTQQQYEAVAPAANNMSDFGNHVDNSILTDDMIPMDDEPQTIEDFVEDDKKFDAQMGEEAQTGNDMQFEREPNHDDQMEDDAQSFSSYYPESLNDDEEEIQSFKQKIIALGTELHVDFEDIGYVREHGGLRAFPLTMRNPPERATWLDGTRAVLRIHGWYFLNDVTSHGSLSEDESESSSNASAAVEVSDNTEQADVPTSDSLNHVYLSVQAADGRNEDVPSLQGIHPGDDESGSAIEPRSPVSATSETSGSSNLSGTTLLNDHLGWFSEVDRAYSRSVLNHGAIDDKQILVERTGDPSQPWRLTSIIGFDQAETLPSVLTRKPWSVLWGAYDASHLLPEETRFSWNYDVDELPTELLYLDADDLRVKQRHEDVLIEKLYTPQYGENARQKYFDDTYGRGRWLRRLFRFAREGVPFPGEEHRFNKLLRDWNHFKKSQNIQPRPLNMWEGIPDYIHGKHVPAPQPVKPPTATSSLQHVYFFIDPPQSLSRAEAAANNVPDDSSDPDAIP